MDWVCLDFAFCFRSTDILNESWGRKPTTLSTPVKSSNPSSYQAYNVFTAFVKISNLHLQAADKPSVIYAVTDVEWSLACADVTTTSSSYHQKQRTCVGLQHFDVCICGVTLVISKDSLNNQGSWLTFRSTEAYTNHSTMLSLDLINRVDGRREVILLGMIPLNNAGFKITEQCLRCCRLLLRVDSRLWSHASFPSRVI